MRTFQPLFGIFVAACVAVMLTASPPAQAKDHWHSDDGWGRRGGEGAQRQWREHEWREREAAREWAWHHPHWGYQPYWSYQYQPYVYGSYQYQPYVYGYGWPRW